MPKISEERKAERREQILAGARRAFAENGYEGATVARLEEATGLSRGAIFNYFPSKEDLFLELAWRDNERLIGLWLEHGWEAALREVVREDPDWLGVYLEMTRKVRTDAEFARRHEERTERELAPLLVERVREQQARGTLRDDYPPERVAGFIGLVADGVVLQTGFGEPVRDIEALVDFVRAAVAPPTGSAASRKDARGPG
ncbi:MAG TPA: helix-turn-helix domain-containing protein [Gaiellaceae bacterium]|nr:helix-turn-helix domain-containing protein [Gaiellaceae bacterium]